MISRAPKAKMRLASSRNDLPMHGSHLFVFLELQAFVMPA
jgi:hypothetical protein